MPSTNTYGNLTQTRTAIAAPNAWVPVTIPQGAKDANLTIEGGATAFRTSTNAALNPAAEGTFVPAGGAMEFEGTATANVIVQVSAVAAPVVAILQYEAAQ
jgi:hypothetical protein